MTLSVCFSQASLKDKKKADILMSTVDKFANQPINDALIDELTDLLYEAAVRSSTPRKDIRRIMSDQASTRGMTAMTDLISFAGWQRF